MQTNNNHPYDWHIGYCTNVHSGVSLAEVQRNLQLHTMPIRDAVCPDEIFGIGLWLSETATNELAAENAVKHFGAWLRERKLLPFTVNAFPFGDFHQSVVKTKVYRPDWASEARLNYTCQVADILHQLLPPEIPGSISTLPLGWTTADSRTASELRHRESSGFLKQCVTNLRRLAEHLDNILHQHHRLIVVCLEPEPGCVLDRYQHGVEFFNLLSQGMSFNQQERIRRHLGVCHDICHSAVMFEKQSDALDAYRSHEIRVGKIQVSSAIEVNFDDAAETDRNSILNELHRFCEPKYLHQTCCRDSATGAVVFYEDLPLAIEAAEKQRPVGQWRIHFHVPIFLQSFGWLHTTQPKIAECLDWCQRHPQAINHFEIETYAWNVLPAELRPNSINDGIASELEWFARQNLEP